MKAVDMNGIEILCGDKIRINGMKKVYEVYKIVHSRYEILGLIFYKDLDNNSVGMSAPDKCIVILEDPQSFIKRVPI